MGVTADSLRSELYDGVTVKYGFKRRIHFGLPAIFKIAKSDIEYLKNHYITKGTNFILFPNDIRFFRFDDVTITDMLHRQ